MVERENVCHTLLLKVARLGQITYLFDFWEIEPRYLWFSSFKLTYILLWMGNLGSWGWGKQSSPGASVSKYTFWKMLKCSLIKVADSEAFTVVCLIFNATVTPTTIIYAMR